ncbi:MAG: DNA (cytosine-5-)-methyltransferase [Propionibacteriaceae bacterium]|jgi:DNA (cytosine-5)-methyltransferase 1|nr:DNA (cytosine-5-)-methyltransferase [Propionibacteriaceae bacterium]
MEYTQRVNLVSISEAAAQANVSIDTLRRWDKGGILRAVRDSRGARHFNLDEVLRLQAKKTSRAKSGLERNFVIHQDSEANGYKSIDLFAGAGGTALGLSHAGFEHILLSELDPHAVQTLSGNRPNWHIISGDVAGIDFSGYRGRVDLVEGGFPCQAFSYAGHSRGFADTRGTLFFEFARAVAEAMPKVFIGENVRGLLRHDGGRTLQTMMRTLGSITDGESGVGYRIAYRVVRAQYHDVPQKRERLIIMGVREDVGRKVYFPKERDYIVSLWDAIGDKPESEGQQYPQRKKEILDLVPPGGYWRNLPDHLQREYLGGSYHLSGGKTGMARRLSWDEPSLTLTCSPAQKQTERCHPDQTRPLNVREYARIQTFPDDWRFFGGLSSAYKQIGNAVPVNLGYFLGKCSQAVLDGGVSDSTAEFAEEAKASEYFG